MRSITLMLMMGMLVPAAPIHSGEADPADAVRVFATGMRDLALKDPTWEDGRLSGTDADTGSPVQYPMDKVRVLRFPVTGEKRLAHRAREVLRIREPVRFRLHPLPDGLQYRLTIPMEPGLYFTPLVGPEGAPRRNTFRFWIGEDTIHAQGRGVGRTQINSMDNWSKRIPRGTDKDIHLELFIDRKGEVCHLRLNHRHIHTWKIPTSYEEKVEGDTWAVIRSGIDPQHVQEFAVYSWSSRRYPDPDRKPASGRDEIWLQNGDMLSGRVAGIENKTVRLVLDAGPELALPFTRVREIRLAPR